MTVAKNSNLAATNLTGLSPKEMSELLSNTIPAKMDPTQLQLAYGQRAIPKLVKIVAASKLQQKITYTEKITDF